MSQEKTFQSAARTTTPDLQNRPSFAIAFVTGVSSTAPLDLDRFLRFAGVSLVKPSAGVLGGFAGIAGAAGVAVAWEGESKKSTADARRFFFCAAGVVGAGAGVEGAAAAGAAAVTAEASGWEARAFLRFSFLAGA